ncbi:hypothetical protein EA462_14985 [Natrarchaeobius halalkaliphilus]|uniref:Uncharacterized protein n=1 Tax=Natrarchaeobius halalkaliphilus TaxID=1679091 RepID=A0A3N6NUS9_9EURY|nr:hypothetical protein EA462_14985 [Natrarchaeobius halalkaliphilus]
MEAPLATPFVRPVLTATGVGPTITIVDRNLVFRSIQLWNFPGTNTRDSLEATGRCVLWTRIRHCLLPVGNRVASIHHVLRGHRTRSLIRSRKPKY